MGQFAGVFGRAADGAEEAQGMADGAGGAEGVFSGQGGVGGAVRAVGGDNGTGAVGGGGREGVDVGGDAAGAGRSMAEECGGAGLAVRRDGLGVAAGSQAGRSPGVRARESKGQVGSGRGAVAAACGHGDRHAGRDGGGQSAG